MPPKENPQQSEDGQGRNFLASGSAKIAFFARPFNYRGQQNENELQAISITSEAPGTPHTLAAWPIGNAGARYRAVCLRKGFQVKDFANSPVGASALARVAADYLDQIRNRLESELRHHERNAASEAEVANVELSREEVHFNTDRFEQVTQFLREVAEGRI